MVRALILGVLMSALACAGPVDGPDDQAADETPATAASVAALIEANTAFALDLFGALRKREGNLCLSPYSISTALAMTHGGARNETARQMAEVLNFAGHEEIDRAYGALLESDRTASAGPGCRLCLANALWGQEGYGFLDDFLSLQNRCYGAGLRTVDFANACGEARKTINLWVENRTEQKIKELLQETDLDRSTALVLTNAIYFKGEWARRFDASQTRERPFLIDSDHKVMAPTMSQRGSYPMAHETGVRLLELPYEQDRLSMLILLPGDESTLGELERSLTRPNLNRWIARLREETISVSVPRFNVKARFDLAGTLSQMGMTDAFSSAKADFSGMTGKRDLFISAVIHQACAEVTEEGTEAAAATAVVMKRGFAHFDVNRPFVFLIRDRQSGSILFMGRVVDPTL